MFLRSLVHDQPKRSLDLLPWAELWHNTTYNVSIGMTPFFALYGKEASSFTEIQQGDSSNMMVEKEMLRRQGIINLIKVHLDRAKEKMKLQADQHRLHIEFNVGDWVFVKLKPYQQLIVAHRLYHKLSPRYFGPFQISAKISSMAYQIDFLPNNTIHNVFHISMLRIHI